MQYTVPLQHKERVESLCNEFQEHIRHILCVPVHLEIKLKYFGPIREETIREVICTEFEISFEQIQSNTRRQPIALARQLYCYCCRIFLHQYLMEIARRIHRDHTSVLYAVQTISDRLYVNDDSLREKVIPILDILKKANEK